MAVANKQTANNINDNADNYSVDDYPRNKMCVYLTGTHNICRK